MKYAVNFAYRASFRRKGEPQQPLSDILSTTKMDSDSSDEDDSKGSIDIPPTWGKTGNTKKIPRRDPDSSSEEPEVPAGDAPPDEPDSPDEHRSDGLSELENIDEAHNQPFRSEHLTSEDDTYDQQSYEEVSEHEGPEYNPR